MKVHTYDSNGLVEDRVNKKESNPITTSPVEVDRNFLQPKPENNAASSVPNTEIENNNITPVVPLRPTVTRQIGIPNAYPSYSDRSLFGSVFENNGQNQTSLKFEKCHTSKIINMILDILNICLEGDEPEDPEKITKLVLYGLPEAAILKYINSIKDDPTRHDYVIFSEYPSDAVRNLVIGTAFGYNEDEVDRINMIKKMIDSGLITLSPFA